MDRPFDFNQVPWNNKKYAHNMFSHLGIPVIFLVLAQMKEQI